VVTAWTVEDADRFPSAVRWRNVVGVQFHPEKSSAPGVRLIRAFLETL
jgi:glutamine amidotransferase